MCTTSDSGISEEKPMRTSDRATHVYFVNRPSLKTNCRMLEEMYDVTK